MDSKTGKKKLIYIMGYGRSGSTLLENLLCSNFNVNAYGEIKYIYERGVLEQEPCSCKNTIEQCDFWSDFSASEVELSKAKVLTDKFDSSLHFFLNKLLAPLNKEKIKAYRDIHKKTIDYILKKSKQDFVIDSSKMPGRAYWLFGEEYDYSDIYVIHLVRDPRGVAWSCQKEVVRFDSIDNTKKMPRFNALSTFLKWYINLVVSEYVLNKIPSKNVYRLRYEDLATNPKFYLDDLKNKFDFLECESDEPYHSISGNPARFNGGLGKVKLDEAWKSKLTPKALYLSKLILGKKLRKYKYE